MCHLEMNSVVLLKTVGISMVVVTKKNTNNKKAISAIEPAFISGISLLLLPIYWFFNRATDSDTIIETTAVNPRNIVRYKPISINLD